jgi:hypothetical protein
MYLSHSRVLDFCGQLWLVNGKHSGYYPPMLKRMLMQLAVMLSHYARVHVLRFDLHQPSYTPTNARITQFNRRLFKRLKTQYGLKRVGFCWVREQERAKAQHYHYVLMLDGRAVQYPHKVLALVSHIWAELSGSFYTPKHCYYNLKRGDIAQLRRVVYRISYLTKGRGKGYRPAQTKDYSCSRLKGKPDGEVSLPGDGLTPCL